MDSYLRQLVTAVVERDADDLMPGDSEDPAVAEARDTVAAARRMVAAAPELDDATKEAVRAALRPSDGRSG